MGMKFYFFVLEWQAGIQLVVGGGGDWGPDDVGVIGGLLFHARGWG